MFVLNGKVLQPGKPFNHKGLQYPGDWLGKSTPAQRAAIGIVSRSKTRQYQDFNPKFYFSAGNPRDLDQVKETLLREQNQRLSGLLSPTDWQYVRQAETGIPVPAEVADHRAECRAVHAANENLIISAESVEELEVLELGLYPTL